MRCKEREIINKHDLPKIQTNERKERKVHDRATEYQESSIEKKRDRGERKGGYVPTC